MILAALTVDSREYRFVIVLVLMLIFSGAVLITLKSLLTAPLRRWQHAQLLLDVLEAALKSPGGLAHAVTHLAVYPDYTFDVIIGRLKRLGHGENLASALAVPTPAIPTRMLGLIEAGLQANNLPGAIEWCRETSRRDHRSRARGATNFIPTAVGIGGNVLLAPIFVLAGLAVFFLGLIGPKFQWLFRDFREILPQLPESQPWYVQLYLDHPWYLLAIVAALSAVPLLILARYRLEDTPWLLRHGGDELLDAIDTLLPWRQRRLQRDFSFVLAMLLDGGLPEPKALQLAAAATGSLRFQCRADDAIEALRSGRPLAEVVAGLSRDPAMGWHWRNALASPGPLSPAIRAWCDHLDARAYRQEQVVGQVVSTLLYLGWGLFVLGYAIAIFTPVLAIEDGLGSFW